MEDCPIRVTRRRCDGRTTLLCDGKRALLRMCVSAQRIWHATRKVGVHRCRNELACRPQKPIEKAFIMNKTSLLAIASILGACTLAGCAEQPIYPSRSAPQPYPSQGSPAQRVSLGTVDRIELIGRGDANNIVGTVIGGIVGGLIGHQIGGGRGQTITTIAGAAGGAYVGNQVEQRRRAPHESFRVTVRMDNGGFQTITEDNITDLRTGDRVRVDGNKISRY